MTGVEIAGVEISDIEITRTGPSYAIDTFHQLKARQPADEFLWIVGADVLQRINTWHRWEEFVSLVPIVAVNRLGIEIAELPFEYTEVQMPEVRISATSLRKRYAEGDSNKYLVPDCVDSYIKEQSLYMVVYVMLTLFVMKSVKILLTPEIKKIGCLLRLQRIEIITQEC